MNPTSPFQIGDHVEITGPDALAGEYQLGQKMKLTMLWESKNGSLFSDDDKPWYPASSLRKVEELHVGDYAKVIGPALAVGVVKSECGKIDRVTKINPDGGICVRGWYYPRSSLQKVDGPELKIGEWVEVMGESVSGCMKYAGQIFQIECISDEGNIEFQNPPDLRYFSPISLRKLTPEEITKHEIREFQEVIDKGTEAIRNLLAPLVDERLSAIEKRQGAQQNRMDAIEKKQEGWHDSQVATNSKLRRRCHDADQILAFLEKWQMEHDLERTSRFRTKIENIYEQAKTSPRSVAEIAETMRTEAASGHATLDDMIADGTLEVHDFGKVDVKTQKKIIRQLEEELADGCAEMTCAECKPDYVDLSIDDRKEALAYAIRKLRMPDMKSDPKFEHTVADVLEGMLEEVGK